MARCRRHPFERALRARHHRRISARCRLRRTRSRNFLWQPPPPRPMRRNAQALQCRAQRRHHRALAAVHLRSREAGRRLLRRLCSRLLRLTMPLGGARLHLKNLIEFTGKDDVRLAAAGPRFPHRTPHSRPQAAGQPHRRRWRIPMAPASCSRLAFLAHPLRRQRPHSAQGSVSLCACTLMLPASAAGAGRASASPRPPTSSSTTSR